MLNHDRLIYDFVSVHTTIVCSDGGFFNAIMIFPSNYPLSPPTVRFISEMWHPNGICMLTLILKFCVFHNLSNFFDVFVWTAVYPDGRVCISILHPPGDDPSGYELASERWSPVHTVCLTWLKMPSFIIMIWCSYFLGVYFCFSSCIIITKLPITISEFLELQLAVKCRCATLWVMLWCSI